MFVSLIFDLEMNGGTKSQDPCAPAETASGKTTTLHCFSGHFLLLLLPALYLPQKNPTINATEHTKQHIDRFSFDWDVPNSFK